MEPGIEVIQKSEAFRNRISIYQFNNLIHKDLRPFFADVLNEFKIKTQAVLMSLGKVKTHSVFEAVFSRPYQSINDILGVDVASDEQIDADRIQTNIFYFQCETKLISQTTNLDNWFETNVVARVMTAIDELQEYGSGWKLHEIRCLDVTYCKSVSFNASSYIPLPASIKNKHAVINVKNNDNKCFLWTVISALYPAKKNSDRVSQYIQYENEINLQNITFPVSMGGIEIFEKNNPTISINVYVLDKQFEVNVQKQKIMVTPIRLTEHVKEKHLHLLLLYNNDEFLDQCNEQSADYDSADEIEFLQSRTQLKKVFFDSDEINKHYCWIKNLSALVGSEISKRGHKVYICDRCLNHFHSDQVLQKHIEICKFMNSGKVNVPNEENRWVSFKNYQNQLEVPFIVYADIESLLVPLNDNDDSGGGVGGGSGDGNDDNGNRFQKIPKGAFQKHIPNSIAYYFHSRTNEKQSFFRSFTGSNCIDWFMDELLCISREVFTILNRIKPMHMTTNDNISFQNATVCNICGEKFTDTNDKVRDHCHLSGKYRGAAHNKCNLMHQITKVMPVVFHNLDYDSHFLIDKLSTKFTGMISIIPKNAEKYISFTKIFRETELFPFSSRCNSKKGRFDYSRNLKLRFIDSFRFLQCSLEKLASYLPHDKMKITRNQWTFLSESDFKLLTQKGVYPYSYMDSWGKMNDTQLPSIESFFDTLTNQSISEKEYEFAEQIWNTFNIQTMRDYTELYLKTDVLLLADIFENFRDNSIKLYKLDPAHYFTLPGYSWDCMLKTTKVNIELFTDIDKVTFVERGLRGGISQCSLRYCKANNKYLEDFDPNESSSFLMYFDVNNLYGWAMIQPLPISNFEWLEVDNGSNVNEIKEMIENTSDDSDIGYMLEVDLIYPQHLHDLHNDYPFCCEHMKVGESQERKLILNLNDKQNYVLHYRTLKLALKNGLILKKVHKILQFKQSTWLKDYIMLNTHQRSLSTNDFETNLYKLMNNAAFGKSLQNNRNYVDIKLVIDWNGRAGAKALIAKPTFKRCVVFNSNLIAVEMLRTNVIMDKPIIVGASILEISKLNMYDFHYDFMIKKYSPENCKIAYTDTDSFVYKINCDDVYMDLMKNNHEKFDTSNFPQPNIFNIEAHNKKIVGVMKDENNGQIMSEFVGLRSKMYALKVNNNHVTKKAKGVKKNVLQKEICFDDFIECLIFNASFIGNQRTIKSYLHKMYTINTTKVMLDQNDDKRHVLSNGIDTLAIGHYKMG